MVLVWASYKYVHKGARHTCVHNVFTMVQTQGHERGPPTRALREFTRPQGGNTYRIEDCQEDEWAGEDLR